MFGHCDAAPFGGRPLHARRRWRRRRRGGILPYLAAAFLIRAVLRRGRRGWGRGPWGWEPWYGPHGERGHGRPWGRGGWARQGKGAAWGLRAEIGPLVGLLRDAFRRGGLDDRQVDEIRAVLRDARRRIAAILGETRPSSTEL